MAGIRQVAGAAVLLLAACVPDAGNPPQGGIPQPDAPGPTACGATELQYLLGQPAAVLSTMKFATTVRVIRPMTPITEDYSEQRLNIDVDANEKISRIWCG